MRKSDTIAELSTALSKLQGELVPVKKGSENPFFKSKYADLATMWGACHKLLANNGLSVAQASRIEGDQIILVTTLMHSSGEWLEGEYPIDPEKQTPQGYGSAITYARRYTLAAMLGIAAEDEDDDAEGATDRDKKPKAKTEKPPEKPTDKASDAQRRLIFASAKDNGYTAEDVKTMIHTEFNIESTNDLTRAQASHIIDMIKKPVEGEPEDMPF